MQSSPYHGMTTSARLHTVALPRIVPHSTKSTYWLCTRLPTDFLRRLVASLSISSAREILTDPLYLCLETTNLLTGFLTCQLALLSVKSFWWVFKKLKQRKYYTLKLNYCLNYPLSTLIIDNDVYRFLPSLLLYTYPVRGKLDRQLTCRETDHENSGGWLIIFFFHWLTARQSANDVTVQENP